MFVDGISGRLMRIRESNQTRFEFDVWFPYTRGSMTTIHEGALIAVLNFASDKNTEHHSIMRITSALPKHYALGTDLSGYPGFVEEAAANASNDWAQETSTEDTTKIECRAVPTTFEIKRPKPMGPDQGKPVMVQERSIPMIGEEAHLLNSEWAARVINYDLQNIQEQTITLGRLVGSDDVDILVLWDGLIRTHFGVFAYTNAGKSNLLSTLITKVYEKADDAKMVIYDLMGEYWALLIDVLYGDPNAYVVYLSPQAMPGAVLKFWEQPTDDNLTAAAKDIVDTTVLPKALLDRKPKFYDPVKHVLCNGRVKMLTTDEPLDKIVKEVTDSAPRSSAALISLVRHIDIGSLRKPVNEGNINSLIKSLENYPISGSNVITAQEIKEKLLAKLRSEKEKAVVAKKIDQRFKISQQDITNSLNTEKEKTLCIMQDSSDAQVRLTSHKLGKAMLRIRREMGRISPPVSFIYDEADQFIADKGEESGMKEAKGAAQELARRGRKYGLGIGIATQRIVHLDSNVLGQPHTYFVSKLPRVTDRERVQEAFGISDETLGESLRFGRGQWLLISHSATGIDGLPIPIQLPDANARIISFLDRLAGS